MSVKQPNVTEWKQRVRTRIRRSDGVVALISSSTPATTVPVLSDDAAILPSGLSVLTASRGDQTSSETADARGKFSTYLEGACPSGGGPHEQMSVSFRHRRPAAGAVSSGPDPECDPDCRQGGTSDPG